jgi:ABC-type multidrug transport system fused ATPase/permease subunit
LELIAGKRVRNKLKYVLVSTFIFFTKGYIRILFNTSIKENLLFSKPDATDEEIIQALKDANAWDFIQKKM